MHKLYLKPKRGAAVRRFHPWIFSGAIDRAEGTPQDGDTVEVYDHRGDYLATGHYQEGSIRVRICSFERVEFDLAFWTQKLTAANQYRQRSGITTRTDTNCYRLVHAEGDGLPGLIIDIYGSVAVMQCHSIGMFRAARLIQEALQQVMSDRIDTIYNKSKSSLPRQFGLGVEDRYHLGEKSSTLVREHGANFRVNWESGQKTGFFLDQRDNRLLLQQYAADQTVLNAFCYTGGFSVAALQAGAKQVDSVDVSDTAMALTAENIALNQGEDRHEGFTADVLTFLKSPPRTYDLMVVDPPAFAKNLKKRHNAVQGYKRLNALAMKSIRPGGLLFTFSCSQVVSKQLFQDTILAAALEAGRRMKIMHHLTQPADHPVSLFHPEGSYLKGLVLYLE